MVVRRRFSCSGEDVIVCSARDRLGSPKAELPCCIVSHADAPGHVFPWFMFMYNALLISEYNTDIVPSTFRLISIGLVLRLKLKVLVCRSEEHLTVVRQVSSHAIARLDRR